VVRVQLIVPPAIRNVIASTGPVRILILAAARARPCRRDRHDRYGGFSEVGALTWPRYPDLAFGLILVGNGRKPGKRPRPGRPQEETAAGHAQTGDLAGITERIGAYDRFFQTFGFECPLPKHLKRTVNSGFPVTTSWWTPISWPRCCAGILVAVADFDRFDGGLTLDLAGAGEPWTAHGRTRPDHGGRAKIVLRDEKDIVCVLSRARTKRPVSGRTPAVPVLRLCRPGVEARYLRDGLTIAAETTAGFGRGEVRMLEVY
jgi:hypothetical protein